MAIYHNFLHDPSSRANHDQDGVGLFPRTLARSNDKDKQDSKDDHVDDEDAIEKEELEDSSRIKFGERRSAASSKEAEDDHGEDDKAAVRSDFVRFSDD